jgi:hypothetical protein
MTYARRTDTTQQLPRTLSVAEYNALNRRPSKMGNKRTMEDNIDFASRLEAQTYLDLKIRQNAGEITGLEMQVRYPLFAGDKPVLYASGRHAEYVADFVYFDLKLAQTKIIDAKGRQTDIYKLKRAIMRTMGFEIEEIRQ